jgi:hypothetical protein
MEVAGQSFFYETQSSPFATDEAQVQYTLKGKGTRFPLTKRNERYGYREKAENIIRVNFVI